MELHDTLDNPKEMTKLVRRLRGVRSTIESIPSRDSDLSFDDYVSDNDSDITDTNELTNTYETMSEIIDKLNAENAYLRLQVQYMQQDIAQLKNKVSQLPDVSSEEVDDIVKNHTDSKILQKQILDTRTMLLQTITRNVQAMKKEIHNASQVKNALNQQVKHMVKEHLSNLPSIEERFEDLAKEQRNYLMSHVRKLDMKKEENTILEELAELRKKVAELENKNRDF